MVVTTSGAVTPSSLEALKQVKATEAEWDARLDAARRETEETLHHLRSEGEAAIRAAHAEAERDRAVRLEHARAEAETEAEAIVADGRRAAERAAHSEGRRPSDKRDAILEVVLGSFEED